MKLTRRDMLLWSAGATAGLLATPVPWKLLDDISIWTQNWPWIPQPARGPVEVQQSFCTLCPQGCGLRVRMVEGWPVGVAGMPKHPSTGGALCPLGFAAHQLIWHPQRLRAVRHRRSDSSWDEVRTAFGKACSEGPILIVDGRPGRAVSSIFQYFAKKRGGAYRVVPSSETGALAPYERWTSVPAAMLGYDLENAQTVVSFGAPLLDGWGTPGRFTRLWANRAAGKQDPQLRLIQVEASCSRTAARAWQWIPIQPGTETALAAGLARVLIEEHLVPAHGPMPSLEIAEAARQTGLGVSAIRDLARTIVARPPALVIANDDSPAIAALNVILGAVGTRGGIVRRPKAAKLDVATDAISNSVRAVLIDSTVPWDFSPHTNAEVFRFAAWDGGSSQADWLMPAPGFLEELMDVPTAPTAAVDTYAIATALVKAPAEVRSAVDFLTGFDPSLPTVDKTIHARCQDLFHGRAGTLSGQQATPVANSESAQKMEDQMRKGAVWVGEAPRASSMRCDLKEWPVGAASEQHNWLPPWAAPVMPPLASKLYQESNLREALERGNA